MKESTAMDARRAQIIQNDSIAEGRLLLWAVYEHPKDYPEFYIARPWLLAEPLPWHLQATTLAHLRLMLPRGLFCLPRACDDDMTIVETWI